MPYTDDNGAQLRSYILVVENNYIDDHGNSTISPNRFMGTPFYDALTATGK